MKPQQPDIDWCLADRELVMRWLERRGGLQDGDRVWTDDGELSDWREGGAVITLKEFELHHLAAQIGTSYGRSTDWCEEVYVREAKPEEIAAKSVWLPTSDDVLEMLEKATDRLRQRCRGDWLRIEYDSANQSNPWKCSIAELTNDGERTILATPRNRSVLIALMELLKNVEEK